jgi:hypothetical protein
MKKRMRPGWGHWRALWVELVCNLLGCKPKKDHRPIFQGGITLHVPCNYCERCRRSWDGP